MNNIYKRGFTLIEILVVIAIIGILSSVVLSSLSSARDKGGDAAVKSGINNMRSQAEITYIDTGSYDSFCEGTPVVDAIVATGGLCRDSSDIADTWVFAGQLLDGVTVYCVDSSGNVGEYTIDAATEVADGVCDADGV